MTDTERRALATYLFGTGKDGDPPGPIHPGWAQRHLTGTRTTLGRWRKNGIPPDRLDDVLDAIRDLLPGTTKDAPPAEASGALSSSEARVLYEDLLREIRLNRWLTWRGHVGLAGLAVSPYVLPSYLLMLLLDARDGKVPLLQRGSSLRP